MFSSIMRATIILIAVLFINGCTQKPTINPPRQKTYPPDFHKLPMQLGAWKGKEIKIDTKLTSILGADYIIERQYQNKSGNTVSMHIAVFPYFDLYHHDPILCYKSGGWEHLEEAEEQIQLNKQKTISVNLSRWRKNIPQVQVLYWYQLDDRILFHQEDVKNISAEILNEKPPPRLVKVLLSINENYIEGTKIIIKDMAKEIAKWIEEASETTDTKTP